MVQKQKHMYQFEPEVKLLKRAVQVKEQVLEAIARRLKIKCLRLKNLVNSTGKHLCRSLFLIKSQT